MRFAFCCNFVVVICKILGGLDFSGTILTIYWEGAGKMRQLRTATAANTDLIVRVWVGGERSGGS